MVQYKRRHSRRRASSVKSISTRRPTAGNQRSQLLSLSRKVNTLSRKQINITEKVYYQAHWDANVSANYAVHSLVTPATWTNVFGQSDNVSESRKLNISRLYLDYKLSPHTEHAEVDFTVFLVTPINNKVMRETSAMTTFTSGGGLTDYTWNNGIVFMNPKRFHIHKVWRAKTAAQLTLVNATTNSVSATATSSVRKTYHMPFKKLLRNSTGTWSQIANDEIPVSAALTLIAFNNNSAIDLENPNFKGTAHFTCYA